MEHRKQNRILRTLAFLFASTLTVFVPLKSGLAQGNDALRVLTPQPQQNGSFTVEPYIDIEDSLELEGEIGTDVYAQHTSPDRKVECDKEDEFYTVPAGKTVEIMLDGVDNCPAFDSKFETYKKIKKGEKDVYLDQKEYSIPDMGSKTYGPITLKEGYSISLSCMGGKEKDGQCCTRSVTYKF